MANAGARGTRPSVAAILAAVAAAALIALLAFGLARQSPDTTIDDAISQGRPASAPEFELDVLNTGRAGTRLSSRVQRAGADKRIALSELSGVPLVINIWASWCDPCREEAEILREGWRRARRQGLLFLGLNQQDATDDAREFLREFRVDYPNVRDPDNDVPRSFGATGVPETYFISADGRVVAHAAGAIDAAQLERGVEAARAGTPVVLGGAGPRRAPR